MPAKRTSKSERSTADIIRALRARVRELEETFSAIQRGRVDALVVNTPSGDNVFTLHGAEHPYRVLVETMNEGAATLDSDGTVLYANASFARILGISLEKVIGATLQSRFSPLERERLMSLIGDALRGLSRGELNVKTSEGQERHVRFSFSLVDDFGVRTICVVATDLTEISGAAEALKSSEDALRNLSGRLLRLQDEERRRISRDLHDVTGQKLALLSMDLSNILNHKRSLKHPDVQHLLTEAVTLAKETNQEIRTLSYVLHPPLLDELGLCCAVEWFTQGFENRTGIQVTVDVPSDLPRLSPDAEVALFRVVQEGLANVHRYAESPTAWVRARSQGGELRLEIGDCGKGMSDETNTQIRGSVASLGVGIQGMKERLRQLSGRLEITSQPGQGTQVTACLPIGSSSTETRETLDRRNGDESGMPEAKEVAETIGSRRRILIADDHEVFRRGIRTMLENERGLEICDEAVDGKEAIEKTLAHVPDLVILDINMPIFNGFEVVRQIVRRKLKTKILVLSVHDSAQIAGEVLIAGAHSYMSKSAAAHKLVDEVNSLLDWRVQIRGA